MGVAPSLGLALLGEAATGDACGSHATRLSLGLGALGNEIVRERTWECAMDGWRGWGVK